MAAVSFHYCADVKADYRIRRIYSNDRVATNFCGTAYFQQWI